MNRPAHTSTGVVVEKTVARPVTVMVVDDEKDLRDSVCELLAAHGYDVLCAENGEHALEQLRKPGKKPDIILLDLMMPRMNGWQFREEQCKDPGLATIPVAVITATRNVRQIQADEILYKPIKLEQLLDVVKRWCVPGGERPVGLAAASASVASVAPGLNAPPAMTAQAGTAPAAVATEAECAAPFSEQFVEMLGHDLRNPLSAISMTGGLLSNVAKAPEIAESTARILAVVDRMDMMIAQLLDFLRLSADGELPLKRRPMDLVDACDRAVGAVSRATGREITLAVTGETQGTWDRERVELLLSTLLSEACDRDRGERAIEVRADASASGSVRFEVAHHGSNSVELRAKAAESEGPESREHIEEECLRLGMGMYVAQHIVWAHGGELQVTSDAAETRFTVELPRS